MASAPKEFTVRCISCNIDVVDIMDRGTVVDHRLRVRCPKCGELSYFHKISVDIGYVPCNNFRVVDIQDGETIIIEVQ
jgi:phage FluMu protein Com